MSSNEVIAFFNMQSQKDEDGTKQIASALLTLAMVLGQIHEVIVKANQ